MTKLIVGCGYLGCRIAKHWIDARQSVYAMTRSNARAEMLKQQGIEPIIADITQPATLGRLPEADTVLFSVGYDAKSGRSRREYYVNGLQAVLEALSHKIERFIFISSTSVYGQTNGQWVDENSICLPTTESGLAYLEAENVLTSSQFCSNAIILRLAGIYGPDRMARRTKELLAGEPVVAYKEAYLNLIHVDDAATIAIKAALMAKPPVTYIVADGHPVKYCDYLAYIAKLAGSQDPQIIEPSSSKPVQARRLTNKRLSNAKMISELSIQLKFPSYTEGLASILHPKKS
jgi:nucleoside-diphosphate-sugar epimerase